LWLVAIGFSGGVDNSGERLSLPPVAKMIEAQRNSYSFKDVDLFSISSPDGNQNALQEFVRKAVFFVLDKNALSRIFAAGEKNIILKIPGEKGRFVELELTRVNILSKDFMPKTKNGINNIIENFEPGLHYRGIIKGDNNSIASVSVFPDFVMGVVSNSNGNYVLGSIKNENKQYTDKYIYYNESDMIIQSKFNCGADELENDLIKNKMRTQNRGTEDERRDNLSLDTVGVYFEADYQMYLDNGSSENLTIQFILGVFNNVAVIYQNEQIPVVVSDVGVWNAQDPYVNYTNSIDMLEGFGYNTQDNFMGDLAHLLSTRDEDMGGIAWINVLCMPYDPNYFAGRFAFSNIEDGYNPYPVYSWTVMVVAHEMGHNFASKHTHSCVWRQPTGGTGALDSCYTSEGNCFSFTRPNFNGTIMSYCHLNGAVNLSLGFGRGPYFSQPGDTIRLGYDLAGCLHYETNSSETPVDYELLQNYPNPFNPVTNIRFALPEAGFVTLTLYDALGRQIAQLIDGLNYPIGIYSYSLDANQYNMASGVYFYRIEVTVETKPAYSEIKKMVLIK